jgi:hypothetical protein
MGYAQGGGDFYFHAARPHGMRRKAPDDRAPKTMRAKTGRRPAFLTSSDRERSIEISIRQISLFCNLFSHAFRYFPDHPNLQRRETARAARTLPSRLPAFRRGAMVRRAPAAFGRIACRSPQSILVNLADLAASSLPGHRRVFGK